MVTSHSRGWTIYFDAPNWKYSDTGKIVDDSRPCKLCGKKPTKEGYDACLGYIAGATSACCGHGVEKPYVIFYCKEGLTLEIGDTREVYFSQYCGLCKDSLTKDNEEPCFSCLAQPVNSHSHKPIYFKSMDEVS